MLPKENISMVYPLTPMQEGMYYHSIKDPSSSVYVIQTAYRLKGNLDPERVKQSMNLLVERHDILRTSFMHEGLSKVFQIVLKDKALAFYFEDLTRIEDQVEREEYIKTFKAQDRAKGFRLDKDALMRITIMKSGEESYELIWTYHHILMDGWSVSVLMQEYFALYSGMELDSIPELPKAVPYTNYINWLESQDKSEAKAYWKNYLKAYNEYAEFPKISSRLTQGNDYINDDFHFQIDKEQTNQLENLARRHNVTVNIVLQVIWGILLAKYNQSKDVVFAGIVSGRPPVIEGVEQMVGLFINAVPIRIKFTSQTSLAELLKIVQLAALESQQHHYYPLADIQAETTLKQNLIDHIFVFENYPVDNLAAEADEFSSDDEEANEVQNIHFEGFAQTNYNFNVNISPGEELYFRLDWNKNLYDRQIIENACSHLRYLVEQILNDEFIQIDKLSLIKNEEKQALLNSCKGIGKEYGNGQTLISIFEEKVNVYPDSKAIVFSDQTLSYQELNNQANKLAHYIRSHYATKPGEFIGVLMDRSTHMVISLLAILKADAVYVPIDPKHPSDRIHFVLKDIGIRLLLTQADYLFGLNDFSGDIFAIDLQLEELDKNAINPPKVLGEDDIAYAIFTSGTSGKPKGVPIRHKSIVDRILYHNDFLPIDSRDVILQYASISFDASLVEIWMALLSGACLVIAEESEKENLALLSELVEKEKVSTAIFPPSLLRVLDKDPLKSLKTIISTGEAASLEESLFYAKDKQFLNGYGPTESCIGASFYRVDPLKKREYQLNGSIPIGTPFANTSITLRDIDQQLMPMGISGEICISGKGLSPGYLNQPELTAEKFVLDPMLVGDDQWVYRTGDLGKWNENGELEFLGRLDQQVQINGIRVEPGEIESLLNTHPQINQAIIKAQSDKESNTYLIAYLASDQPQELSAIRSYLSEFLPSYMLPSQVIQIEEIPVGINGKIDLKLLPEIDLDELVMTSRYVAPVNLIQEQLAEIWQDILKRTPLGVKDNFFNIGGHSLKATQIVSRIYKELEVKININAIFTHPTIEDLANLIEQIEQSYVPLEPLEPRPYYPLSSAQNRLWMVDQLDSARGAYNVPGAYLIEGKLNIEALQQSFEYLIERHEILRTQFVQVQGVPMQEVSLPDEIQFEIEIEDIRSFSNVLDQVNIVAKENFETYFDLSKGPLLRAKLLRTDEEIYVFLLTMHHIISDGWSMEILAKEFLLLYNSISQFGSIPELPELLIQYKEYAHWEKEQLKGNLLSAHREYWLKQMSGKLPILELPTDFPRPMLKSFKGGTVGYEFSKELFETLVQFSKQQATSNFIVLMGLFKTLLFKYTSQTDLIVGSAITGREREDFQDQIGLYTNTIAIRSQINETDSFVDFIKKEKEVILDVYQHQIYPFEKLLDDLNLERNLGRSPLFDVMLVHQNMNVSEQAEESFEGISITKYPIGVNMSRFDLIFSFMETEDSLSLGIEYSQDLFDKAYIHTMIRRFEKLIEQILSAPQEELHQYDITLDLEKELNTPQIDIDFNLFS